ncbi:hypothetical protein C8R47DRAFT_1219854 [Mycena vitilis]|nr:hypothetical protein C8R47DRAFT_1219854 [Mycena vitilis]
MVSHSAARALPARASGKARAAPDSNDDLFSPTPMSSPSMSSPGNQPTLTLKLERDSSPFTPRSPKNFPLQVDISSEDEYEKFLADLCNAVKRIIG